MCTEKSTVNISLPNVQSTFGVGPSWEKKSAPKGVNRISRRPLPKNNLTFPDTSLQSMYVDKGQENPKINSQKSSDLLIQV